jgi:hypothetical protein
LSKKLPESIFFNAVRVYVHIRHSQCLKEKATVVLKRIAIFVNFYCNLPLLAENILIAHRFGLHDLIIYNCLLIKWIQQQTVRTPII